MSDLITAAIGDELEQDASFVREGWAIVEIGSYRGGSTRRFVAGARDEVPIYAVDPWEQVDVREWCEHCEPVTRAEFEERMGLAVETGRVRVLQGQSLDVVSRYDGPPIGLLFVDGDHRAGATRADVLAWAEHLAPAAAVLIDDYGETKNQYVKPEVDELIKRKLLRFVRLVDDRLIVTDARPGLTRV